MPASAAKRVETMLTPYSDAAASANRRPDRPDGFVTASGLAPRWALFGLALRRLGLRDHRGLLRCRFCRLLRPFGPHACMRDLLPINGRLRLRFRLHQR